MCIIASQHLLHVMRESRKKRLLLTNNSLERYPYFGYTVYTSDRLIAWDRSSILLRCCHLHCNVWMYLVATAKKLCF